MNAVPEEVLFQYVFFEIAPGFMNFLLRSFGSGRNKG